MEGKFINRSKLHYQQLQIKPFKQSLEDDELFEKQEFEEFSKSHVN